MNLNIEKIANQEDGMCITHQRAKQRSDKQDSRFLIPKNGSINYASIVEKYLNEIKSNLGVFAGRMFFKGTATALISQSGRTR